MRRTMLIPGKGACMMSGLRRAPGMAASPTPASSSWQIDDAQLPAAIRSRLSSDALALKALARQQHWRTLEARVQEQHAQLAQVTANAEQSADTVAAGAFTAYVAQTALLFYWVYFRFDWNLVEPITYLLGYSCVWISVASWFIGGREFAFDAWRQWYVRSTADRATQAKHGFSNSEYDELVTNAELARLAYEEVACFDRDSQP